MPGDLTTKLQAMSAGDERAADELVPLVYEELRQQAACLLEKESPGHTLQATALVNEAYMKLCDQKRADWRSRTQFFYVGAQAMRRILVDHARAKGRQKRGGGLQRLDLYEDAAVAPAPDTDILGLNEAIEKLGKLDKRLARVVELRYFGGLTVSEVAEALEVSVATIESDWRMTRAWLRRELNTSE